MSWKETCDVVFFQLYYESATISNPRNIKGTRKTMSIKLPAYEVWYLRDK